MDTLALLLIFFVLGTVVLHATKAVKGVVTLWAVLVIGAVAWHYLAPNLVREDQSIVDRGIEIHQEFQKGIVGDIDTLMKGDHKFANYAIGNVDRITTWQKFGVHAATDEKKFDTERETRKILQDIVDGMKTQIVRVFKEVLGTIFLPRPM